MNVTHAITSAQIQEGKERLWQHERTAEQLDERIADAERALEELIAESRVAITLLEEERRRAQDEVRLVKEYLSPMKRLPDDLLSNIFAVVFANNPSCAWALSAVCASWRRIILATPLLWSKIRLVTTSQSSPEFIRLWLERSHRTPLDVEIFLHVQHGPRKKKRNRSSPYALTFGHGGPLPANLLGEHHNSHDLDLLPAFGAQAIIPALQPHVLPTLAVIDHPPGHWGHDRRRKSSSPSSTSWGHIAIYYLVAQMNRWKRFIFRFDRTFDSLSALRNISGDAPLLEEFEISSGEALRANDEQFWQDWGMWLPSTDKTIDFPNLKFVTLAFVPFRWTSPLLSSKLRVLDLQSSSSLGVGSQGHSNMTLDRLLFIIASNPLLETLKLNFMSSQQSILPLETTRLEHLKQLDISGNYSIQPLIDALVTPSLERLSLNTGRDAPDEAAERLFTRSGNPPITYLSLSFSEQGSVAYFVDVPPVPQPWEFLGNFDQLKTLKVGHALLETFLDELSRVSLASNTWLAPRLEHLSLKNCSGHGDCVSKLVILTEARNPRLPDEDGTLPQYVAGTGASAALAAGANVLGLPIILEDPDGTPPPALPPPLIQAVRLKTFEMQNCSPIGDDILKWLKTRIDKVSITDPMSSRYRPRSPVYFSDDD